jgi:hypothetical protein
MLLLENIIDQARKSGRRIPEDSAGQTSTFSKKEIHT